MNRSIKLGIAATAIAALMGAVTGGVMAVGSDDPDAEPVAVKMTGKEVQNGPPADIEGRLTNGKTYGSWYADTPENERPDYMQVTVGKDVTAYVNVEEAWPATNPRMFQGGEAGRKAVAEYMARQMQPNDKGETWTPAYARDGKTIVGRYLISTQEDITD